MTVGRICQREVDFATPDETVQAIAQRMNSRNVGMLVILDPDKRPVGVVTDRDLAVRVVAKALDPVTTPLEEIMTAEPANVQEEMPIEEALTLMRHHGVRRLPVIDKHERLVGVIAMDDILELLIEEFHTVGAVVSKASPRRVGEFQP